MNPKFPMSEYALSPEEKTASVDTRNENLFIGIPNEPSPHENRVALTPESVVALVGLGHRIVVQSGAGLRAGFTDHAYSEAGAEITSSEQKVYSADILLKVAPLNEEEVELLHPNQLVIAPIHVPTLSEQVITRLKQKRVMAVAMDYVKDTSGAFPIVRAMSEIAGISAMLTAAELLSNAAKGQGILLGGVTGVPPVKVVIIGAGMVAESATRVALGLGADVRIFDNNTYKLLRLQRHIGRSLYTSTLNPKALEQEILGADVVIGALHSQTGRTPLVVSDALVSRMRQGAVIVDVSIDQGGVFATSEITNLAQPTYRRHGVIHYCVPNITSRVAQTASTAISNIFTSQLIAAAEAGGFESLVMNDLGFRNGMITYKGCITNQHIANRFGLAYVDINLLLPKMW